MLEISKMEQRYEAVLGVVRDGRTVQEVADAFGVTRQSVSNWLRRYEEGGLEALADRSHRPRSCPHQIRPVAEAAMLEMRRLHPSWGPVRLRHELDRKGVDPLPSKAGIYRSLVRHGLIVPKAQRKRLPTYKRWERGRPNELWQMDVVGGILLEDGTTGKVLTGVDDHSRFCVSAGIVLRASMRPICAHFMAALERHGVPEEVLTDNGKVFTNRFGFNQSEVLFDRICRENGITHILTAPRSPTTTGKVERFHRSLRQEFLGSQTFPTLELAQKALDAWVREYNFDRPHQSLKMATPAERFLIDHSPTAPEVALDRRAVTDERTGDDWVTRKVASTGVISLAWQVFSVGKHRAGELVDVRVTDDLLEVWSGNELIKTQLRTTKGGVRKKRAQRPSSRAK
ncbi:MAG TPA: IS481 family transposase [Acidimicrobiales bacterium]|nr:IS481 family transposase [Acidimicrobiales bacterium]